MLKNSETKIHTFFQKGERPRSLHQSDAYAFFIKILLQGTYYTDHWWAKVNTWISHSKIQLNKEILNI
jgi:hypothetical protein